MAAFAKGLVKHFVMNNCGGRQAFLTRQPVAVNSLRNNFMFQHLSKEKEHDTEHEYEISKDPKEWEMVEKLLPFETIPEPTRKACYPSGWRPAQDKALKLPYFVERSKNHMLSVYLRLYDRGEVKVTQVRRIHGDLWRLHDELKDHVQEKVGKKIASFVHEGNSVIYFKGDYVYHIEQWLLSKGF